MYARINSAYSPNTFKCPPRILRRRLNIFHVGVFSSEYAERMKKTRRKNEEYTEKTFYLQQFLGTLKGQKKSNWKLCTVLGRTNYKFHFLIIFKKKSVLYVYSEYAAKKRHTTENNSVYWRETWKICYILLFQS